jgi:hypothetical protein
MRIGSTKRMIPNVPSRACRNDPCIPTRDGDSKQRADLR